MIPTLAEEVSVPVAVIYGTPLLAMTFADAARACRATEVVVVVLGRPRGASVAVRVGDAAGWAALLALGDYRSFTAYALPRTRLTRPAPVAAPGPVAPRPRRTARRPPVWVVGRPPTVCVPWPTAVRVGLWLLLRPLLREWGLLEEGL